MKPSSFHSFPTHTFAKRTLHRGAKTNVKLDLAGFAYSVCEHYIICFVPVISSQGYSCFYSVCAMRSLTPFQLQSEMFGELLDSWTVGISWRLALSEETKSLGASPRLHPLCLLIHSLSSGLLIAPFLFSHTMTGIRSEERILSD